MTTLHIHARDIVHYDAVGSFSRQVASYMASAGYAVRLWAEHTNVQAPHLVENRELSWATVQPDDLVFFNHSIHDPILAEIANLPNRKIGYFHNITPPEFIDVADRRTVENCRAGLEQRHLLAGFDGLMANSQASADVLLDGMDASDRRRWENRIVIAPPLIGADRWDAVTATADAPTPDVLRLLFVGRLVPHKGVRQMLSIIGKLAEAGVQVAFDIVGGPTQGSYVDALRLEAAEIENRLGVPVAIHHDISDADLKALYQRADAGICHSEHEGFCVPALDSVAFDMPMFTTPIDAVLEVLGNAALVIPADDQRAASGVIAGYFSSGNTQSHAVLRQKRFSELTSLADGRLILETIIGREG